MYTGSLPSGPEKNSVCLKVSKSEWFWFIGMGYLNLGSEKLIFPKALFNHNKMTIFQWKVAKASN